MRTIRDPLSGARDPLLHGAGRSGDSVEDLSSGGGRGTRERIIKASIFRRPLTNNVLSCPQLESGFYLVLSKAAQSGLAFNLRRSRI